MTEQELPRAAGRAVDALRPVRIELGPMKYAEGSALIEIGETRVLAAASVESSLPAFRRESGEGWLTAEYAMLPRATHTRSRRDVSQGRPSGRSTEIQRLIGRSLRGAVDFSVMRELTVTVDCDVLQADGGTRTAAITAGYVALAQAMAKLYLTGDLGGWPIRTSIAAISTGLVGGVPVLDLEYSEDHDAQVDMNIVATGDGSLVEVQGTGEGRAYTRQELDAMVDLALKGIGEITQVQERTLAPVLEEVEAVRQRRARGPAAAKDEKDLWGAPG